MRVTVIVAMPGSAAVTAGPRNLGRKATAPSKSREQLTVNSAAERAEHAADNDLTEREIDVLRLVAQGNENKQIADQLSIGEATVRTHVGNILSKFGANDRTHAVTIGLSRGIIELPAPPKGE